MLNRPLKNGLFYRPLCCFLIIIFGSCRQRTFGPKSAYQSFQGTSYTSKDNSVSVTMENGQLKFGHSCDATFTPLLTKSLVADLKKRNKFDELESNLANQMEILKDLEKYLPVKTPQTILEELRLKIQRQISMDQQSLLFANQVLNEADVMLKSLAVPYCFLETRSKLLAEQKLAKLEVFDTLISMLEQAGVPKNSLTVTEQLKKRSDLVDLRSLPPSIDESLDSNSTLKAILSKYEYEVELNFKNKVTFPVDSPLVFQDGTELTEGDPKLNENACLFWVASSKSYSRCTNYSEDRAIGSFPSQSVLFDDPTKMVVNSSYLELHSENKNFSDSKGCAALVCGVVSKRYKRLSPLKVVRSILPLDPEAYEKLEWWISKTEQKAVSLKIFDLKEILPQDIVVTFKRNKN